MTETENYWYHKGKEKSQDEPALNTPEYEAYMRGISMIFRNINIDGKTTINGKSYSGKNISIINGKVIVDGKTVEDIEEKGITVTIDGDVGSIESSAGDITINGASGSISTQSGDVACGNVSGSISTMSGDVDCKSVGGSVSTMSGDVSKSLL